MEGFVVSIVRIKGVLADFLKKVTRRGAHYSLPAEAWRVLFNGMYGTIVALISALVILLIFPPFFECEISLSRQIPEYP